MMVGFFCEFIKGVYYTNVYAQQVCPMPMSYVMCEEKANDLDGAAALVISHSDVKLWKRCEEGGRRRAM